MKTQNKQTGSHVSEVEYVYTLYDTDWDQDTDGYIIVKHRILRKTDKRIYVRIYQEGFIPSDKRTFVINLKEVKPDNSIWVKSKQERFYLTEASALQKIAALKKTPFLPEYLSFFGLLPGFSTSDLKAAYRKMSQQLHPDRGGSHEAFLQLQQNYQLALEYYKPCTR
jgi:hypothetical protein